MNPIESRYNGKFTATGTTQVTNTETNVTREVEATICENQPCRLVIETSPAATNANGAPAISQTVTLLCSPALDIPPGSKITVTSQGRTESFEAAGLPVVYCFHQEISLKAERRWA